LDKIDWKSIECFDSLRNERKDIRDHLEDIRYVDDLQSVLVRRALSEGFFMNACRKAGQLKASDNGTTYLTVNEGLLVKLERSSSNVFAL
jgi:hypothetical protein